MANIHLLIVDPQFDFCDSSGALFVPGATEDIERLTIMTEILCGELTDIHCTLDSHHLFDIAHPLAWQDLNGNHPDPFTIITFDQVDNQKWLASIPKYQAQQRSYVKALADNGRYPLCIWPPHCLIGSNGVQVMPSLYEQLLAWETQEYAMVDYVTKGTNWKTEHYSAIQADVPDLEDEATMANTKLISALQEADIILLAGEAGSHCLANTVMDIADNFEDDSHIKRLVLLEDATSSVSGFEHLYEDFRVKMITRGMQISTTLDFV